MIDEKCFPVTGDDLGVRLLKVLNLPADAGISKISIVADCTDVAKFVIEGNFTFSQMKRLVHLMENYELKEFVLVPRIVDKHV